MSKQESYSNRDKIILSITHIVVNGLNVNLMKQLRKLRFGFDADTPTFSAEYNVDEVKLLYKAETYLIRNKIPYKRKYVKANLHSYVSNT